MVQKPFWLTLSWTIDNVDVDLQVRLDYSAIHKHRTWHLPLKPPAKMRPTLKVNVSPAMIDRACHAITVLQRLTHRLYERMQVVRFEFSCQLGLADAAQTAIWTARLTDVIAGWIALKIAPRAQSVPRFLMEPVWDEVGVHCNFTSIIQLRLSDIILAMLFGLVGHS